MQDSVLIIGAGQAAAQCVASLRQEGFSGPITVVGDEPYLPYQRPPLSKAFLAGELPAERLEIKPREFYADAKAALILGVRAMSVDRARAQVHLSDGRALGYSHLVFATGSRVRKPPIPGLDLPGVHFLRGIDDVNGLRAALVAGKRLTVVGGGYIGLEVAAVARKHGLQVTVLEMAERVLARVASKPLSAFYEAEHRAHGVRIETAARVDAIASHDGALSIETSGGRIVSDAVLIGAGILPNDDLARAAGLAVDNGIVVDEYGRGSDPHCYAAGDCANLPCAAAGRRLRLESVQNAIDQSKHVAAAIAGKPRPYREVPWFWSDQYDLKLQIAGIGEPSHDIVVRGDPQARSFAVFFLKDSVIRAVEAVNAAPEYMMGRRLIQMAKPLDPSRLADRAISMKEMG